jgi:hypothetical protein
VAGQRLALRLVVPHRLQSFDVGEILEAPHCSLVAMRSPVPMKGITSPSSVTEVRRTQASAKSGPGA